MSIASISDSLSVEMLLERDDYAETHVRAQNQAAVQDSSYKLIASLIISIAITSFLQALNPLLWNLSPWVRRSLCIIGVQGLLERVHLFYNYSHEKAAEALRKPGFYDYCLQNAIVLTNANAICQAFNRWMQDPSPVVLANRTPQVEAAERRALRMFYKEKQDALRQKQADEKVLTLASIVLLLALSMQFVRRIHPLLGVASLVGIIATPVFALLLEYLKPPSNQKVAQALLDRQFYLYCMNHDARWLATEEATLQAYAHFQTTRAVSHSIPTPL